MSEVHFTFLYFLIFFLMSSDVKSNDICYTEEGIIIVIIPRILIGIQELNHRVLEWTGTKVLLEISLWFMSPS